MVDKNKYQVLKDAYEWLEKKNQLVSFFLYALSRLPLTSLGHKILTFSAFLAADSKPLIFLSRLLSALLSVQVLTFAGL